MEFLSEIFFALTWKHFVMFAIGGTMIFLAVSRKIESALLLPMGFGAILVNLPHSAFLDGGAIEILYTIGFTAGELMPLLLFIGIGAMTDFSPLLSNPKLLAFGFFCQLGIFIVLPLAHYLGFSIPDAASIASIGAADGPTAILVSHVLGSQYASSITVAAYSYMALVPVIMPLTIRLLTTKKERKIRMDTDAKKVSKRKKILFPILTSIIVGLIVPASAPLIGFLMFGNLIRESRVLENLAESARTTLTNIITLLLGISVSFTLQADEFLKPQTILVLSLGLLAFILDCSCGILLAKFMNLFLKKKINPAAAAAGISAFPMASRIAQKEVLKEDDSNFILMHSAGINVGGQIASVVAGGILIQAARILGGM